MKQTDASTRVFQYGIRIDDESRELVRQQFMLAHQTYNDIVAEIRRIAKDATVWLQDMAGSDAAAIRAQIDVLTERFNRAKAEDNREILKETANDRRLLWREWYQRMHAARRSNIAELNLRLRGIGERTDCSTYRIRCGAVQQGLGWATANAGLKAAIQAFRKQWPKFKQPNFRRIAEVPRKTLELQFTTPGGIPVESIFNKKCTGISIQQIPARKYADFTFSVGAYGTRQDVHGTVYCHRPLPPEGKVKYARIVEQRIGKDLRHYLQMVVTGISANRGGVGEDRPLAALDFGWYFEDDGRRIAGFADSGNPDDAEIVRLPVEIDNLFLRAEKIKSERDTNRDQIVSCLKAETFENVPEAIQEAVNLIRKLPTHYVASSYLARFAIKWRAECPNYAPSVFARLEHWRKADKMHWQAESHLATRARRRRKKYYEALALDWTSKYGTIVIDSPELAEAAIVKNKTTGLHNKLGGMARGGRVKAALYELEQALVNAASKTGTRLMKIKGRTSKTCSLCGGTVILKKEGDRDVCCSSCGEGIDREKNAAAVVWLQGMSKRETIEKMFLLARERHDDQLQKREAKKMARMQARWGARTPSTQ